MEESTLPLESLKFWSGSLTPGKSLKVRVEEGSLLHLNGACILGNSGDRTHAILTVAPKNSSSSPATLCVLQDSQCNVTLTAYFERTVTFAAAGTGTIHLYGHFVNVMTDEPPANGENEDEA